MIHLLDVNVLLALGYSAHVHNERAETWLQHLQTHNATVNLAMCSITELGFVRVASDGSVPDMQFQYTRGQQSQPGISLRPSICLWFIWAYIAPLRL